MALFSKKHNAVTLLKKDHTEVKGLLEEFESSDDKAQRHEIALKAIHSLKVHAEIEEEFFYPAMRKAGADGLMEEADEEHHVAKLVIAELELMNGSEENFPAKFIVLAENVRHHIKEEEGKVFPKAKASSLDLDALGESMYQRKQELESSGVPTPREEEIITQAGLIHESPAKRNARDFRMPPSASA